MVKSSLGLAKDVSKLQSLICVVVAGAKGLMVSIRATLLDIDLKELEVTVLFFCQSVTHRPPPPPPLIPPPPPEIYLFFE